MSAAVGNLNLVLGLVYASYGIMTVHDMALHRRTRGFTPFGLAWMLMAFTCGPHHIEHGLHILVSGAPARPMELAVVLVGFPAGVLWFLLRLEGVSGGRGDRHLPGTPWWVEMLPTLVGGYAIAVVTATAVATADRSTFEWRLLPNLALVGLYTAIGVVLLRTQLQNHRSSHGWSLSGIALTIVFPTCAVMHGVYALYASAGVYDNHWHLLVIDVLAVPAAAYFLWVVWSLHRGMLDDWSAGPDTRVKRRNSVLEQPIGT